MARPGLLDHPKFKRLVRALNCPRPHALGYLEMLWRCGYEAGNDKIGDALAIEAAAEWPGEDGKLHKILLECGFIDDRDGVFHIHDLLDHAPDYVTKRAEREAERTSRGQTLSDIRAEVGRMGGLAKAARQAASKQLANAGKLPESSGKLPENSGKCMANVGTPTPAPTPILGDESPNNPSCSTSAKKPRRKKSQELTPEFEKFWDAYPRKVARQDAVKAWGKLNPAPELVSTIMAVLAVQKKHEQWQDQTYIPHPASWLNGRRWEDQSSSDPSPAAPAPQKTNEERIAEMRLQREKLYQSHYGSN